MTQINLSTKQKQTHRHREQTCGCQGGGEVEEVWIGSFGLTNANYYVWNEWATRSYSIAQGTISSVL